MANKVVVIVLLLSCINLISSQLPSDLAPNALVPIDSLYRRPVIGKCGLDYCAAVSCLAVYCENRVPANPSLCQCCPQCINDPIITVPSLPEKTCPVDCRLVRCGKPVCQYGTIPANPSQCRCCDQCITIPPIKELLCQIKCKKVTCPLMKCRYGSIPAEPSQCRCCATCSNIPIAYPVDPIYYPVDPILVDPIPSS